MESREALWAGGYADAVRLHDTAGKPAGYYVSATLWADQGQPTMSVYMTTVAAKRLIQRLQASVIQIEAELEKNKAKAREEQTADGS